jgi:hypothetical protein
MRRRMHVSHMRRRMHVSYEEEDVCGHVKLVCGKGTSETNDRGHLRHGAFRIDVPQEKGGV